MESGDTMSLWEPFPLSSPSASYPPLFLRRDFTSTNYSIYMTDMTHVWGESLSKSRIHDRAEDSEASIDPTTDESQLGILLSKLRDGLTGGGGSCHGHVDVELDIRKSTDHDDGGCQILITTREELPKPLRPLVWKFRLRPLPRDQFATLVMLPALAAGAVLTEQVNSLISIIQEKDVASQRMLDKLREMKVDMRNVFPGRKLSTSIDELVRFDEAKWRKEIDYENSQKDGLFNKSFGTVNMKLQLKHSGFSEWWSNWKGKQKREKQSPEEDKPAPSRREPTLLSESSFERLKTPPPRRSSPPRQSPLPMTKEDGDTTNDDDEDLDMPTASAVAPKDAQDSPEDLDMAKGENVDSSGTAMNDRTEARTKIDDDETTDEEADEAPPPPPKAKIGTIKGKIGGKKPPPEDDVEMKSNETTDNEAPAAPAPKKTGKVLRTIGRKKAPDDDDPDQIPSKRKVDSDEEGHEKTAEASSSSRLARIKSPEQMEDAADRKRAELAKKLDAQRRAPPKKHRKF